MNEFNLTDEEKEIVMECVAEQCDSAPHELRHMREMAAQDWNDADFDYFCACRAAAQAIQRIREELE